MRLLLIEDDTRLAGLLGRGLRSEGYAVDIAGTFEDGAWMADENPYDLLVVDVMLPDGDGFTLCRRLRDAGKWTPIMLLTARSAVVDRVKGLDAGADDYLAKPYSFDELAARVRSLLRRGTHERAPVLRVGALTLDPATHRVTAASRPVELSPKEFALLEMFMRRSEEVLPRSEILEHVWDWAFDGTSNVIDVYVRYLRRKLGTAAGMPHIETVRGIGYVLRHDP